jgi:hypothetical protein
MKRILIPFLLCAGIATYLSCQKENSSDLIRAQAAKDAANARRATDSTHHGDTTGTDTCRYCLLHDTTFSPAGDQILIVPVKADSGSYSGLYITATTQNTYPCANTTLTTDFVQPDSGYTFGYYGAHITGFCIPGQSHAQSTKVLFPVQDGTHTFTVVFNNVIYHGSFTKTGNHYSFTWPYSSGVIISPLTIN